MNLKVASTLYVGLPRITWGFCWISHVEEELPTRQPPPKDQPAEPLPQLETSGTPSAPAQYSLEPTMHDVMRRLDRQGRQIVRTQAMIRRAFPSVDFTVLGFSSSSDDSSESQGF
ncbi:hypothetical protein PIB30_068432 [Stylosanthes scabra]|uniref:Uncharacterized protein n=1 Tax=Stylosanthes scabra TaxID=79078 RepID=A0ABU6XN57_9FABA|nr:hypothetical protein [Stylosanthes scabra]